MPAPLPTSQERAAPARSPDGAARLANPARLKSDWEALVQSHDHLHAPEAAILLDVPEAALTASRIGTGATRLKPDVAALLSPISDWGRVLCAFSNACGVHMPLGRVEAASEAGLLHLTSSEMTAVIDEAAVTDAYLFIDSDESHGNTRSVQFFNAAGQTILKVFIFHKTRFQQAEHHLMRMKSANQSLSFALHPPADSTFCATQLSESDRPSDVKTPVSAKSGISDLLGAAGRISLELIGDHARVAWQGDISGARIDEHMFHLHEPNIRAHLRFAPATETYLSEDGVLMMTGDNRRLLCVKKGGIQ